MGRVLRNCANGALRCVECCPRWLYALHNFELPSVEDPSNEPSLVDDLRCATLPRRLRFSTNQGTHHRPLRLDMFLTAVAYSDERLLLHPCVARLDTRHTDRPHNRSDARQHPDCAPYSDGSMVSRMADTIYYMELQRLCHIVQRAWHKGHSEVYCHLDYLHRLRSSARQTNLLISAYKALDRRTPLVTEREGVVVHE